MLTSIRLLPSGIERSGSPAQCRVVCGVADLHIRQDSSASEMPVSVAISCFSNRLAAWAGSGLGLRLPWPPPMVIQIHQVLDDRQRLKLTVLLHGHSVTDWPGLSAVGQLPGSDRSDGSIGRGG